MSLFFGGKLMEFTYWIIRAYGGGRILRAMFQAALFFGATV